MNNKATSFIGEHTAEYVLVPVLKKILKKKFKFVTPIFPWMTREGSNISKHLHDTDKFMILGLYPRRPKIILAEKEVIYIKINEQVILGAHNSLKHGIPIIAGCPLAMNFWMLGDKPTCLWLRLNFKSNVNKEFKVNLDRPLRIANGISKIAFHNENEILKYIDQNANLLDFDKALEAFKKQK